MTAPPPPPGEKSIFVFVGYDAGMYMAEETIRPSHTVPKAMICSTVLTGLGGLWLSMAGAHVCVWGGNFACFFCLRGG